MEKIFDIRKFKRKRGIWPIILPRASGKTTAIIKSMAPQDVCISMTMGTKQQFENYYRDMLAIRNLTHSVTTDNRRVYLKRELPPWPFPRAQSINTLFIDEFMLYESDKLREYVKSMEIQVFNIILIGSPTMHADSFIVNMSYHFDSIGKTNDIINLSEELFVL